MPNVCRRIFAFSSCFVLGYTFGRGSLHDNRTIGNVVTKCKEIACNIPLGIREKVTRYCVQFAKDLCTDPGTIDAFSNLITTAIATDEVTRSIQKKFDMILNSEPAKESTIALFKKLVNSATIAEHIEATGTELIASEHMNTIVKPLVANLVWPPLGKLILRK